MNKAVVPNRVVEWSPAGVRAATAGGAVQTFSSLEAAGHALGGGPVVLALGRRSVFLRVVPLPTAPKADLRRLLDVQAAALFPLPAGDAAFDVQQTDEVTGEGRLSLVVAIGSTELKRVYEEAKAAGFQVVRVVPAAFGSALVAQNAGLQGAMVVESTPEGTALDAIVGGELRASRVVPDEASVEEEVRRTASMAGLIDPVVLVASGLASGPWAGDAPDGFRHAKETPLGALVGPSAGKIQIDLEPRDVVRQREGAEQGRRRRLALLLAASAIALVALVAMDRSDAQAKVDQERGKINSAVNRLKGVQKAVESDVLRTVATDQSLDRAFEPAQPLTDVIATITNSIGEGVWLTGISAERGKPVIIRGTGTSSEAVAKYVDRLTKNPRFRDVKLIFSNNAAIDQVQVIQFSVSAFPVGNLPLVDPSSKRRS